MAFCNSEAAFGSVFFSSAILARFRIKLFSIQRFQNRLRSIILRKKIIAKTTFSTSLQSRTISTESAKIILPGNVVQTFGVAFTASNDIKRCRCARLNGISNRTVSPTVTGRPPSHHTSPIRHLLTVDVKHHNLCRIRQFQFSDHIAHRHFNHLPARSRAKELVTVTVIDCLLSAKEAKPIKATANRINIFLIISLH